MAKQSFSLPDPGTDWLPGFYEKYVILSLKHSELDRFLFWKPNALGYTPYPFNAGFYTKAEVEADPMRYNDGLACVAVPLTVTALRKIDIRVTVDISTLADFATRNVQPG